MRNGSGKRGPNGFALSHQLSAFRKTALRPAPSVLRKIEFANDERPRTNDRVGAVAQLGERLVCNQEATGSIPVSSTRKPSLVVRRWSLANKGQDDKVCGLAALGEVDRLGASARRVVHSSAVVS